MNLHLKQISLATWSITSSSSAFSTHSTSNLNQLRSRCRCYTSARSVTLKSFDNMKRDGENGISTCLHASKSDNSAAAETPRQQHQEQQQNIESITNGEIDVNDPPIKTKRPYNSYLKTLMDDSIFESLHALTLHLKSSWETMDHDNVPTSTATRSLTNQQPNSMDSLQNTETLPNRSSTLVPALKIKPRSRQSLHMTYFFCGTMLNEMPPEQLVLLHSMLQERLRNIDNKGNTYSLKFKSIDVFPPQRRNLIAATFEPSPHLNKLYEELCDIAMTPTELSSIDMEKKHPFAKTQKEYEFPLLRSAVFQQIKQRGKQQERNNVSSPWVAHVTLANIVGVKKSGIKQLSEWLSGQQFGIDGEFSIHSIDQSKCTEDKARGRDISVQGLSLGGPYPQHVDLDWNFPFNLK